MMHASDSHTGTIAVQPQTIGRYRPPREISGNACSGRVNPEAPPATERGSVTILSDIN